MGQHTVEQIAQQVLRDSEHRTKELKRIQSVVREYQDHARRLEEQNKELLGALKMLVDWHDECQYLEGVSHDSVIHRARQAIARGNL